MIETYDEIFRAYEYAPIYDYRIAVHDDIYNYIDENGLKDATTLYDNCFISDAVTGNASGSYYCNSYRAERALHGNTDLLIDALENFGDYAEDYKKALLSPEYADVTIRCYVISEVLEDAITDYINDHISDTVKAEIENMYLDDMINYIIDNQIIA